MIAQVNHKAARARAAKPEYKPIYASVKNAYVEAIIAETFRFASVAQALERLDYLSKIFIKSKQQAEGALTLWVEGYALTDEEIEKGYLGNFAAMSYREVNGKYTLAALKLNAPLKNHPQKKRITSSHPNWGHPVLRMVKKRKLFRDFEQAQELLNKLHEEYPMTTIPLPGKLNIMVYSRTPEETSPIKKHVLIIRPQEEQFVIEVQEKKLPPKLPEPDVKRETQGKFTSMVMARKKKKR